MWNGLVDPGPSPLEQLERDEELQLLRQYAGRHIPGGMIGIVLRMSLIEECSLEMISLRVRMSAGAVAEMVRRGSDMVVAQIRAEHAAGILRDREQRRLFHRRGVQEPAAGAGRRRPPGT